MIALYDKHSEPSFVFLQDGQSDKLLSEYKNALTNFKGGKSLHAPFWDLNLGSKNPGVREATMKAFNYAYKVAKELGCTEIVVHNGFIPNTSFYEGWVRNATAFWQEFFSDKDDLITMNFKMKQFKKEITIPYEKIAKIRLAIEF